MKSGGGVTISTADGFLSMTDGLLFTAEGVHSCSQ